MGRFGGRAVDLQKAADVYDDGILQADQYLRRIFTALAAKGYLRDYFALITADHGQSLGEHGVFGHWQTLYEPEVRIPALFVDSDAVPFPEVRFARQVDLAPTLLDRLDLPVPTSWEGCSLLTPSAAVVGPCAYLVSTPPGKFRAVVAEAGGDLYKYLFDAHDLARVREQLFDLATDPTEKHDLMGSAPKAVLKRLRDLASHHFHVVLPQLVVLDAETRSAKAIGRRVGM